MKKHPMLKYLKEEGPMGDRLPMILCPGCGSGQVLNAAFHAVDKIIEEDGIAKKNFVFITGVGCSARLTSHYLNFDSGWTIHGRTLPIATIRLDERRAVDRLFDQRRDRTLQPAAVETQQRRIDPVEERKILLRQGVGQPE